MISNSGDVRVTPSRQQKFSCYESATGPEPFLFVIWNRKVRFLEASEYAVLKLYIHLPMHSM